MAETDRNEDLHSSSKSNEHLSLHEERKNEIGDAEELDVDCLDVANLIEQNHLELVTNLDLGRQFMFSYLRSKGILDEEDCETIINTGNTRQQKASIFLDTIKRKGSNGMNQFLHALGYQYPELYKKLTGCDPAYKVAEMKSFPMLWTDELDGTVLAKQLEQTVSDLHRVTKLHQKVHEEKCILEKKLFEEKNTNRMHLEHIDELKQLIEKISDIKKMSEDCSGMSSNEALAHAQCLELAAQRNLLRQSNMIIALQGKLLAQTEEIENIKKESMADKKKNDTLAKELKEMTVMFDEERRNSKRLNEQVNRNIDDTNHHCKNKETRNLQLQLSCAREDNERLRSELEEFRKFSEVLNAKFNIVSQEKLELTEHNEEVTFSYQDAQEKIKELTIMCTSLQSDRVYLTKTKERLMSDIIAYEESQKSLYEVLERLRVDRDEAWAAVEKSSDELLRCKRAHDETMHNQILINRSLEQKYSATREELDVMRDCLNQTKDEVVATKKQLGESSLRRHCNSVQSAGISATSTDGVSDIKEELPDAPMFAKRSNQDLLNSIKRKVSESEGKSSSVQPHNTNVYSCLSYEQMNMLLPDTHSMSHDYSVKTYPRCRSPARSKNAMKESLDAAAIRESLTGTSNTNKSFSLKSLPTYMKDTILATDTMDEKTSLLQKNVFTVPSTRKMSETGKEKRERFVANECSSTSSDVSVFSHLSSQNNSEQEPCNSPPASHSSYVQTAMLSPQLDYPPSFLHSTNLKKTIRSGSDPTVLRTDTLSSAGIFMKSMSVIEHTEPNECPEDAFRSRSCLVNADHKSSWERRRSLSVPVATLHSIAVENFSID